MNIEKIIVWLPAALLCCASVIFTALYVLAPKAERMKKFIFAFVCALSALAAFFLYLYTKNRLSCAAGIFPARHALAFAVIFLITAPLGAGEYPDRLFYFPAASMLFIAVLGYISGDPATAALLICLSGVLLMVFSGRDSLDKNGPEAAPVAFIFFFFLASFIFLEFYFSSGPGTAKTMAYTGFLAALVISSPSAFYTLQKKEPASFPVKYAPSRLILQAAASGVQIVLFAGLMAAAPFSRLYMTLLSGALLGMAMFKSITEETYPAYASRDSVNIIYLALLYFSCAPALNGVTAVAACGVLLSAASSGEMIRSNSEGLSVTAFRLSPAKVKNSFAGLLAQIITLAAEITLIIAVKNSVAGNPAVQAAALISLLLYLPALLNRLFGAASAALRFIKVDTLNKLSFNDSALKLVLYGALSAALFYRW
jgi:hypothetical protein